MAFILLYANNYFKRIKYYFLHKYLSNSNSRIEKVSFYIQENVL